MSLKNDSKISSSDIVAGFKIQVFTCRFVRYVELIGNFMGRADIHNWSCYFCSR